LSLFGHLDNYDNYGDCDKSRLMALGLGLGLGSGLFPQNSFPSSRALPGESRHFPRYPFFSVFVGVGPMCCKR